MERLRGFQQYVVELECKDKTLENHDSNRLKSQFEKNMSTIGQRAATRHSTFYVKIKDIKTTTNLFFYQN